jgi:hypothetical protein
MVISTLLSSGISPYLGLLPPDSSVHFGIEEILCSITVRSTLRGVNEILRVGWLPHHPSHAFDDVSIPVFDRALVMVIPSHILETVLFPLPESLIIFHGSHKLLDTIRHL